MDFERNDTEPHPAIPADETAEGTQQLAESSSGSDDEGKKKNGLYEYQNSSYWALPEHVRHAIDQAKKKSKHSEFYNRLSGLNDKILIYKLLFYSKAPKFE